MGIHKILFLFRLCVTAQAIFIMGSGTKIAVAEEGRATSHSDGNSSGQGVTQRLQDAGVFCPRADLSLIEPAQRGVCLFIMEAGRIHVGLVYSEAWCECRFEFHE